MPTDVNDYYEFINEEMSAIANRRLRDAIHDIVVGLKPKEIIDVEELSSLLSSEFKINISPSFLDKFLDDFMKFRRGGRSDTFFTKGDIKWLGVRDNKGKKELRNNLLYLKPSLSKHKRVLFQEEEKQKLETAYKEGMKELNFTEDVIKKTLILQYPEDSKEMMKSIYNDIIVNKRYKNTYENCWKLMILIGREQNLDRVRGYWKYAPSVIKKEFAETKRINLELEKTEKSEKGKTDNKDVKKTSSNQETTEKPVLNVNYNILKEVFNDYDRYFYHNISKRKMNLSRLVRIIDRIELTSKHNEFSDFLSKTDEMTVFLMKFYKIKRQDVISTFKKMELDKYLNDWEKNKKRPKINDF